MKKIAINTCFGGFSLSAKAVKRIAELQGKKCYFFKIEFENAESENVPIDIKDIGRSLFWSAYSVPNPDEITKEKKRWFEMTSEEKDEHNKLYNSISLDKRYDDENRTDKFLIQVIEELGKEANGYCAELKIVEIPDDVEYTIEEYDGLEHIAEKHKTWS